MSKQTSTLIIVQDPSSQYRVIERLRALGATIQTVPDCLSAMGLVKGGDLDLVILADCSGEFDALDTMRVLKSLRTDCFLPVAILADEGTEHEGRPGRAALLEAGADDVIPSDCDVEVLQCHLLGLSRLKSVCDQLRQVQGELSKTLARENSLMSQLREDNRDLKVRSITDGLTGLYNYRYLMEWLRTEFKISRRYGHNLSMIIVDIDHFKSVNDEHGHPFGDHALKEVAAILRQSARESDLVARYAGDEFAIVCPRAGHKEASAVIKRILVSCRKHNFEFSGKRHKVTLSLGTATYPEDSEVVSPEMLVFLADQALYNSKNCGRNTGTAWSDIDADVRMKIRRKLRGACHPLLADDPKSRLELAAAEKLLRQVSSPPSLPGEGPDAESEP
jgi:diguanylate cyclase (GGDEF)-like protein